MIIFDKITLKNFVSWGNQPITLNLDFNGTTLVYGHTGSGKSSLVLDALFFVLFGKPYKNVNKATLINSINNTELLVTLDFHIDSNVYQIQRGMKPNVFLIHENGEVRNQNASARDDQKYLESKLLHINERMFRQIVLVGSNSVYVPFLKLPLASRRDIIENLFGLKIFSTMLVLLKNKITTAEQQIELLSIRRQTLEQQIEREENLKKVFIQNAYEEIDKINAEIHDLSKNRQQVEQAVGQLSVKINALLEGTTEQEFHRTQNSVHQTIGRIRNDSETIKKVVRFFTNNTTCPTCKQPIEQTFKESTVKDNNQQLAQLKTEENQLLERIAVLEKQTKKISDVESLKQQLYRKIREIDGHINRLQQNSERILEQCKKQNECLSDSIRDDLKRVENEHQQISETLIHLKTLLPVFKDTGIKSLIVQRYLDKMNALLAEYLHLLQLPVSLSLDEEFKETIRSRFRDVFSYENFSSGEQSKIDLAIMLLLREMAKYHHNMDTNLIVFDEADAALDKESRLAFFNLYQKALPNKHIIVISHQDNEENRVRYTRALQIARQGNFSHVVNQEGDSDVR